MTREERENALHCLKVMIDEEVCEECNLYGTTGTDHCEADCVRVAIKALEQEPKTGHWIYICNSEVNGLKIVKCSECSKRTYGSGKYCPNCGTKMIKPQESEDKDDTRIEDIARILRRSQSR